MAKIIGIVPAGGRAKRVHGFFKEMLPIGVDKDIHSKFIVSSEQIISGMFKANAEYVHLILGEEKYFIEDYYRKQKLFPNKISHHHFEESFKEMGMPYTIDSIYNQIESADYVLMGMPDTVIEPISSFSTLHQLISGTKADLALGLYRTDNRNKGGYIEIDPISKKVITHIDKTQEGFPDDAENAWAIVCWNKKFTKYMHDLLKYEIDKTRRSGEELLFGNIINSAIVDENIKVVGDYIDLENGLYWDMGEPEKYFELLRFYSPGDTHDNLKPSGEQRIKTNLLSTNKKVFIGHGHSSCWEGLSNYLEEDLNLEVQEFHKVPPHGLTNKERVEEMLNDAGFAFIVMTAEEEREGKKLAARDNVIHEVGLFQGKLGFKKAIILLEEGCKNFSNIDGLVVIPFSKGNVLSNKKEIHDVLKREGLLE